MENMTVATRIANIRLLELMKKQPEYAKQMGLVDVSHYNHFRAGKPTVLTVG